MEKSPRQQKHSLDNSILTKIYTGQLPLTSPRVKLSRQRESETCKEILHRNSGKFTLYKISPGNFPIHKNSLREKFAQQKIFPPILNPKMYAYSPITNTIRNNGQIF